MEPVPAAVEVQSLNHWAAKEAPEFPLEPTVSPSASSCEKLLWSHLLNNPFQSLCFALCFSDVMFPFHVFQHLQSLSASFLVPSLLPFSFSHSSTPLNPLCNEDGNSFPLSLNSMPFLSPWKLSWWREAASGPSSCDIGELPSPLWASVKWGQ